jgi:hypothetical protein
MDAVHISATPRTVEVELMMHVGNRDVAALIDWATEISRMDGIVCDVDESAAESDDQGGFHLIVGVCLSRRMHILVAIVAIEQVFSSLVSQRWFAPGQDLRVDDMIQMFDIQEQLDECGADA